MPISRFLYAALTIFFCASSAMAGDATIKCDTKKILGKEVSWCHEWDESAPSTDVVYYFHGVGGTEKIWRETPLRAALQEAVKQQKKAMPHVFAVSFGFAWFLTDVKDKGQSRLDLFLKKLMPALEGKLKQKPTSRILIGESMGGYNVLRTAMADPKSFARVVALCPAILPIGPYASEEEQKKFAERNPQMDVGMTQSFKQWVQQEFPTAEDWTRNNPLDRAEGATDVHELPLTLLSDNSGDEFGFTEGTAALVKNVNVKGGRAMLRPLPGSHCQHSPELLKEAAGFVLNH